MAKLKPVQEARDDILSQLPECGAETILLAEALGRIVAEDVRAGTSHPLADISAMDGYAVRSQDTGNDAQLQVIGESAAGHPFQGELADGDAIRIFTGAYLPKGADAIVLQEETDESDNHITASVPLSPGRYIRRRSQDFARDDILLSPGDVITARSLSLCALALQSKLLVKKQPSVALLSSGDELVPAGSLPRFGQMVNSNSVFLASFLRQQGAIVHDLGILADEEGALTKAIDDPASYDLIISTGGASVGKYDFIVGDLQQSDEASLSFWKIAMRPGKPLISGKFGGTPFIGLPGNPVSVVVCALIFLQPALAKLTGAKVQASLSKMALCECDLPENDQREDYLRGQSYQDDAGNWHFTAFDKQDSGMLHQMVSANALGIRPPFAPALAQGDAIEIIALPEGF
ncbi:MAG: gephyrin-like molybdotransferase Glp [Candidatus Puniceispirillaceae bacterium]